MSAPTRVAAFEIRRLGDRVLDAIERLGQFALLAGQTARAAVRPRFPAIELLRQFEAIGARSSTIVLITALFTGMVLALQTGIALARFGAKPFGRHAPTARDDILDTVDRGNRTRVGCASR